MLESFPSWQYPQVLVQKFPISVPAFRSRIKFVTPIALLAARTVLPWHHREPVARLVLGLPWWLITIVWLQQVSKVLINFKCIHIPLANDLSHSLGVSNFRWLWNSSKTFFSKKSRAAPPGKVLGYIRALFSWGMSAFLCSSICNSTPW